MKQYILQMRDVLRHACMLFLYRWSAYVKFLGFLLVYIASTIGGIAGLLYITHPNAIEVIQKAWIQGLGPTEKTCVFIFGVISVISIFAVLLFAIFAVYIRFLSNIVQYRRALTWSDIIDALIKAPQLFLAFVILAIIVSPVVILLAGLLMIFYSGRFGDLLSYIALVSMVSWVLLPYLIVQENCKPIRALFESYQRMYGYRLQWIILAIIPFVMKFIITTFLPIPLMIFSVRIFSLLYNAIILKLCTTIYYYMLRQETSVPGLYNSYDV